MSAPSLKIVPLAPHALFIIFLSKWESSPLMFLSSPSNSTISVSKSSLISWMPGCSALLNYTTPLLCPRGPSLKIKPSPRHVCFPRLSTFNEYSFKDYKITGLRPCFSPLSQNKIYNSGFEIYIGNLDGWLASTRSQNETSPPRCPRLFSNSSAGVPCFNIQLDLWMTGWLLCALKLK